MYFLGFEQTSLVRTSLSINFVFVLKPSGGSAKAATIVLETLSYLEKTPAAKYSSEKFKDFESKLFDLKIELTHAERLMILNHCPRVIIHYSC